MADELMTLDDMADGKLDLKTIAIYTSGDENVVNKPRLAPGVNVGSLAALNKHVKDKVDLQIATLPSGRKGYATLAAAQAAQASLPANTVIEVNNDSDSTKNGVYTWDGTTLTRSSNDVLGQAKAYTDNYATVKVKALTASDDLNDIKTQGNYAAYGLGVPSTTRNYPTTRGGHLRVDFVVTGSTGTIAFQTFQTDTGEIYQRYTTKDGSAWLAWQQILKTSDLDSASVMVKNIADGTDINTLTTRGQYYIDNAKANTYLNLPPQMVEQYGTNGGGTLTVVKGRASFITHQYFDGYAEYGSYFRSMNGSGGWNPWFQIGSKVMLYSNKDLNNLLSVGKWICYTQPADNSNHHFPPVLDQYFVDVAINGNVYRQTAYARATNEIWTRSHWGTNRWQPWVKITTQTELDSLKSEINSALTEVILGDEIKADLSNPFKPTRIKLIGDSITWGMGSSAGSPIEPRSGKLSDVRNTVDTSVSKTWANLLRTWIAKVYGNATVTEDKAGSAYTSKNLVAGWRDIYKQVKMTNPQGTVLTDAQKLAVLDINVGFAESGTSFNFINSTYGTTPRPYIIEFDIIADNLTILYQTQQVGDANDIVEIYVDGTLVDNFNYYAASNYSASKTINFTNGKHTIKLINKSTYNLSYVRIGGFKINKKSWVVNEGIIGSSTKTWLDRNLFEGTLDGTDDVILMMLGTNDRGTVGGVDGFRKRFNDCIDKINTLSPNSKLVLMSSTFANTDAPTSPYMFDMGVVDKIIASVAKERNLMFISNYKALAQAFIDGESVLSDGLHLNDLGNKYYYETIRKKLFDY